jgi:ABC-type multidrug transport system ATPase subunit
MQIEIRGLTRRFGSVAALRDVHCAIPSGRRVALVGPNGSGKSTLNRVLLGLLRYEGDVRIDGASPLDERMENARRIAYVPQAAPSLAVAVGPLISALARIRDVSPARVAGIASDLGLDVAALLDRPFRGLSGGMKQKLLLALALAADAKLLVLDEPTGSLDARTRERFFALCEELTHGATLILCSHRLEEVRHLVDHVLVLDAGRLVYDGPAAAFLDASATGMLEICADGEAAARWLGARAFVRRSGGWWTRVVGRAEKRELLEAALRELGPAIRDVAARDLERLEVTAGEVASRGAAR